MSTTKRRSRRLAERRATLFSDHQESQRGSINSLTPKLLMKIFHYLPHKERLTLESVCKHWRQWSQGTWRNVRELSISTLTNPTYLTTVNSNSVEVQTGDISVLKKILPLCGKNLNILTTDSPVDLILKDVCNLIKKYCRHLEKLDMRAVHKNGKVFCTLLRNNSQLKSLKIRFYDEKTIYLQHVPAGLEEFKIHSIKDDNVEELTSIVNNLPALRCLEIPAHPTTLRTVGSLTNLTSLCIGWIWGDHDDITRELLNITKLRNLEYLSVNWIGQLINDEFLMELSRNCRKIRRLFIAGPESVTKEGLSVVATLPDLEELDVSGQMAICDEILLRLQKLRKLDVSKCTRLTSGGIVSLIEKNKKLEELKIVGFGRTEFEVILVATKIIRQRDDERAKVLNIIFNVEKSVLMFKSLFDNWTIEFLSFIK